MVERPERYEDHVIIGRALGATLTCLKCVLKLSLPKPQSLLNPDTSSPRQVQGYERIEHCFSERSYDP